MNNTDPDNARIGYQAAVSLWTYEGQLIWSRFNAMVVANGIILAAISVLLTTERVDCEPVVALSALGIILCLIWALMTARGFDYHKYWIWSARELEENHLSPTVKTASRGRRFAEGHEVYICGSGRCRSHQIGCPGRFSVRWASYGTILLFAIVYMMAIPYCLAEWG